MATGISGRVSKKTGNHMPGIGMGMGMGGGDATNDALSGTEVVVFRSDAIAPAQIKTLEQARASPHFHSAVTTDAQGNFEVTGLEPDTHYTVVANVNGKLYLNSYDSLGNWSSVKTAKGQIVNADIEDTSEAFF